MGRPGPKRQRLAAASGQPPTLEGFDPDDPEASLARIAGDERRRRLGQFFTPLPIAELMCDWAAARSPASLLDPAAGPGMLVRTLLRRLPQVRVTAIDIDPLAIAALRSLRACREVKTVCADFLTWTSRARFDAILANPPYLRHHDLLYPADVHALVEARNRVKLSRLTNAYGLFLLEICRRLTPGGRAAVIVPGEWLNANFGAPLKEHLLSRGLLSKLLYFASAETVFEDALTTACVLFLERPAGKRTGGRITTLFARSQHRLGQVRKALAGEPAAADESLIVRSWEAQELPSGAKWNALLERGAWPAPAGFVPLGELASTLRGIATGANAFFHVSPAEVQRRKLPAKTALDCIGRAADVSGLVFRRADLRRLESHGRRTRLLCFREPLTAEERRYLREGETAGLPDRYLLARRTPWFAMERRSPAPIWAAVFSRRQLRFIYNAAGGLHLTTFHGVYPFDRRAAFHKALCACLNSRRVQSLAADQLRVYGGGLLKFEPRDLLQVPVPDLRRSSPASLAALAGLLQRLDAAFRSKQDLETALDRLDRLVDLAAAEAAAADAAEQEANGDGIAGNGAANAVNHRLNTV